MTIVNSIIASKKQQDTVWALENCFKTWDGDMDIDVIVSGIADRLTAMGLEPREVGFKRVNLKTVEVYIDGNRTMIVSKDNLVDVPGEGTYVEGEYRYCFHTAIYNNYFNDTEKETMAKWLLNNFYHV